MTRLYCPECSEYLEGGDGECHDCSCGWKQPVETFEDETNTLQVAYDELCEELEDSQRQLDVAKEFCRQYQIENKHLKEKLQIRDNQVASKKAVIEELEIEIIQLKNVIGAMDDIITTPDNQIKGMLYDTLLERDELKKQNSHLQFLLDSVMLEFCPDEMTEKQMENWKKHQEKSNLEIEL